MKAPEPTLTSRTRALRLSASFLLMMLARDEERRLDGAGVVAEGIEDAVGGDDFGGLADEGGAALFEDVAHLGERELGVEAGDGLELVECAAGVAEAAAADHGDDDAGDSFGGGMSEAGGGEDGGDQEGGFVADSAGGVLVDGEGVEGSGVDDFAGEAHGGGEGGELARVEASEEDGHEEGGDLGVGDELFLGGAVDDGVDEGTDLLVGEGEAVALVEDDVDGMDGFLGSLVAVVRRKAAGRSSAMVVWVGAVFAGEEDDRVGCAELVDGLAAGSAGLAGGVVEVGDDDGSDADLGAVEGDGSGDGVLFRADCEPVGGVFDVAAGDDLAVGRAGRRRRHGSGCRERRRCGRRRWLGAGGRRSGWGERSGRHECEAIGWMGGQWAS